MRNHVGYPLEAWKCCGEEKGITGLERVEVCALFTVGVLLDQKFELAGLI
jgi:hypothetical protein